MDFEKIKTFTIDQIEERCSQIVEELNKPEANIDELYKEVEALNQRKSSLKNEAEKRNSLLESLVNNETNEIHVSNPIKRKKSELTETIEYRSAFKEYVQKGTDNPILKRENQQGVASELGVLLPQTVIQKVIKELDGVYGQLYSRVRKTNIKGGVKYPIGSFKATFKRITETTTSDRQKGGSITGNVEFSYNIGEIRLARTLLQEVLSVDAFEVELAKVIAQAYVQGMDTEIVNGSSDSNQMEGIFTDANKNGSGRIKADHIISFTAEEMKDWTSWQTKLFAKIPLAMRKMKPEFVMTAGTYEANIKTLQDANKRPVYSETYNPVDGEETARFKGREVVFVEEDICKSFDDAANDDIFGMLWVPEEAYAINSNLEFTMIHYFDQETNQYVDKALVINDGKILDSQYIFILKKKSLVRKTSTKSKTSNK